jgi:hypothetical protein
MRNSTTMPEKRKACSVSVSIAVIMYIIARNKQEQA